MEITVSQTIWFNNMPKPRKKKLVEGRYFAWLIGTRNGVFTADGRSNTPSLGRHSLGTRNRDEALQALEELDLTMAVRHGLADATLLQDMPAELLSLEEGRRLYEEHVKRPPVAGGPKPSTAKRYRAVFDKFLQFAEAHGIRFWNEVGRPELESYAAHLDDRGYAYATEYLELNTIKQINGWLIGQGHLAGVCRIVLPLRKPEGTDTYCWRPVEVQAMVEFCLSNKELAWLADIITSLAVTGLRISELAGLRWGDVDLDRNVISIKDESTRAERRMRRHRRTTKNRRSRSFPLHSSLCEILDHLPLARDGRVFRGPRGGILKADTVRNILIRDVITPLSGRFPTEPGEIGFADGRLHSFRHYFCSVCANTGVPEQVVMRWLGQQSSRMVRHYYHLHDDEAQRQMQRVQFLNTGASDAG